VSSYLKLETVLIYVNAVGRDSVYRSNHKISIKITWKEQMTGAEMMCLMMVSGVSLVFMAMLTYVSES